MWCRWWNNINRNIRCSCLPWRWYVAIPFVFTFTVCSALWTLFCMAFLLDILTRLARSVVYGYWANHLVLAEKGYPWFFIFFLVLNIVPLNGQQLHVCQLYRTNLIPLKAKSIRDYLLKKYLLFDSTFPKQYANIYLELTFYICMSCYTYWLGV